MLTGFHVSTTIFASGLATLCFIFITKREIPLYYGSSFSYIAAIVSITGAKYGQIAPDSLISEAQFGIVMSGLVSIIAGLIVKRFSMDAVEKVLPPAVTGSIAIVIGLSLAGTALNNVHDVTGIVGVTLDNADAASTYNWIIALVTLISTILFSVYLKKGTWGQIPILLGLGLGYVTALIIGLATDIKFVNFALLGEGRKIVELPHFTLPKPSWAALAAIMPIAIATIPESTAHIFQLDIYVNKLAELKKSPKNYPSSEKLCANLIGDGMVDIISGMIGDQLEPTMGKTLVQCQSLNFSVKVLITAAIITMVISSLHLYQQPFTQFLMRLSVVFQFIYLG